MEVPPGKRFDERREKEIPHSGEKEDLQQRRQIRLQRLDKKRLRTGSLHARDERSFFFIAEMMQRVEHRVGVAFAEIHLQHIERLCVVRDLFTAHIFHIRKFVGERECAEARAFVENADCRFAAAGTEIEHRLRGELQRLHITHKRTVQAETRRHETDEFRLEIPEPGWKMRKIFEFSHGRASAIFLPDMKSCWGNYEVGE